MTVLEGRTVAPEHYRDYHDWVHRTIAASERFPGARGITVLSPEAGRPGERFLILAFVDEKAKRAWQQAEDWARLKQEAATFSTPRVQTATGTEPWFTLPEQEVASPPRWKMSPGATSYLWDSGTHRFLFTGDSLWIEYGEWKAVALGSSDRAASLDSLRLISDLDFDVLVPWAAMKGEPSVNVVNHDEARKWIDAIIARVEAGRGY